MPGQYEKKVYLANNYQEKFGIVIQPETQSLSVDGRSNADAGDDYTGRPLIHSAIGRRTRRPIARTVAFRFSGAVPEGYKPNSIIRLPWLRPEGHDSMRPGMTGEYKGFPIEVMGKYEEKIPRA